MAQTARVTEVTLLAGAAVRAADTAESPVYTDCVFTVNTGNLKLKKWDGSLLCFSVSSVQEWMFLVTYFHVQKTLKCTCS